MNPDDFQAELDKRETEQKAQDSKDAEVHAINKAGIKNVEATNTNTRATVQGVKSIKAGVKVTNPDLAKTADLKEVTDAIHKSNLTAYMANKGLPELADNLSTLNQRTQDLQDKVADEGLARVARALDSAVKQLATISKSTGNAQVTVDKKLQSTIDNLTKQIGKIDFNPSVNVSAPDTKVVTTPVDFAPILKALQAVQNAIEDKETPDNRPDLDPVISGLSSVQTAITSLRFPVPNYVLPFKDVNGKDVQVQLDSSGNVPTSGGSGGGSTQYTDGAVPPAHPIGNALEWNDGSIWQTASTAKPLPVSGTFSSTPVADVAPATQNVTVVDSGSTSTLANNGQILVTGSPTAGSAASFSVSSLETVRVQVTGTWTGTLTSEISIDGGTTWFAQGLHQGAYTTSTFFGNFVGGGSVTGATNFRIRATATVTGTAVVKIIESINTNSVYIANAAPAGTVISLLNSSTATLTSGSVFTGAGEDVSNFSEMRISVFSNVASAGDGLSIQQSPDNTNWDITDTYTIAAATGKTFAVPRMARYFRIVYTNGGTNQTSFRLQSILNRTATAPSSQRATDGYTNETDLVQNQVFNMGFNGTTWDRLRTTGTGVLSTSAAQGTAAALTGGWPTINGEAGDVTGTFTNATQTTSVTANNLDGYGNTLISINGTYAAATAIFEGSDDSGTTWYTVQAARDNTNVIETGYTSLTNTSQTWQINNPGFDSLRVRSTAVTSGTVNVRLSSSAAPVASGTIVGLGTAIPTGGNGIGTVGTTTAVVNVGQQTVNTTAVQISASSTVPTNGILIGALTTNTASIFIGGSGVTTTTGAELAPGASLPFTANLNTLYIRSVASTTDKIWYSVT